MDKCCEKWFWSHRQTADLPKRRMGSHRRKRRRPTLAATPTPQPTMIAGPWENLPDSLLLSVLDRLLSLRDLLAAAAVCRSWRTLACLSSSSFRRPPLLLRPEPNPTPSPCRLRRRWSPGPRPSRCDLLCPVDHSAAPRRSPVPAEVASKRLIGFSHGHLIFCARSCIVLANPFASFVLRTAETPCDPSLGPHRFYYGALTAPVSSPDSMLLLLSSKSIFLWHFTHRRWTDYCIKYPYVLIDHIVVFKNKCYALSHDDRMFVLNFSPQFCMDQFVVQWEEDWNQYCSNLFKRQLVQCGDELMLVQMCFSKELIVKAMLVVHRLDFTASPPKWVKVENLGDWAVFIDYAGRSPVACHAPGIWGGKRNCIYYANPGCHKWSEFLLDGKATIDTSDPESPFFTRKQTLPNWPSPLWVYPSAMSS